ncbi:unnamed protein product, partial [Oppiella nova]
ARNVVEVNASQELDFDGVKVVAQTAADVCDFWRNFAAIVDYIKSVRRLRFGSIPTFVVEEVVNSAVTENPYNSFHNLEHLSIRNCFDEDSEHKHCSLHFLSDLQALRSLRHLVVNSKNGFVGDNDTVALLSHVFAQMELQTLVLTSLKDFSSEDFVFLRSLRHIQHLEIGSCHQWFQKEDKEAPPEEEAPSGGLSGAFLYLSELQSLRVLRLVDLSIDDSSHSLPKTLEALSSLESLTIDNLRVDASGLDVLSSLVEVLRSLRVRSFALSTDDSLSNRFCCDHLLKKLDACARLEWKVGVLVEDSGECFVPFAREEAEGAGEEADAE